MIAEVNGKAIHTRHSQGWVDEVIEDLGILNINDLFFSPPEKYLIKVH